VKSPGQYIYFEGDEVECIYFLKNGKCGTVLPRHQNMKYIDFPSSCYFGEMDLVCASLDFTGNDDSNESVVTFNLDNWMSNKDKIKRQFTVMADY